MNPMKIVVPDRGEFAGMAHTIEESLGLADLVRNDLNKELNSFASQESTFETETEGFLSRINAEITSVEKEISQKDIEINNIREKISQCQAQIMHYDETAEIIDNEKMAVSDEINELYDSCSEGEDGIEPEVPDVSDQIQHISELDDQYMQLISDRQSVIAEISELEELLSQKEAEKIELIQKNNVLKDKESSVRTRFMGFLTSFRAMLAQIEAMRLLDESNPVLQDARSTGLELNRIGELLSEIT